MTYVHVNLKYQPRIYANTVFIAPADVYAPDGAWASAGTHWWVDFLFCFYFLFFILFYFLLFFIIIFFFFF